MVASGSRDRYRRGGGGILAHVVVALVLSTGTEGASAQDRSVNTSTRTVAIDIPAQSLDGALATFGAVTGMQVLYDSGITTGRRSSSVSGRMAPTVALRRLLAGTGLSPVFTGERTVTIVNPAAAASPARHGDLLLDTIVVTAARAERALSETPSSVQIVERAQIEEQLEITGDPSTILSKITPGYSVSNQTISGASETFRGRDVLVMIDGVPLNTPLRNVSRIVSMIDLNSVERIEVVAGASSLYGSDATGGTINFITKRGEAGKPTVSINTALRAFTANIGQSLAPEASVTVSGKESEFDYVVTATGRMADKTYDGAGRELPSDPMLGQGGADRFKSGNLFAKFGRDFDGKRLEVSGTLIYLNQTPQWLTDYTQPFARPDFTQPYTGQTVLEDTKSFAVRYTDSDFPLGALKVQGFYNDVKKRFNFSTLSGVNNLVYYSGDPANPTSPYNQTTLFDTRGGVNTTVDTPLDRLLPGMKLTWGADIVYEKARQTLTNGADVFTPLEQMSYAGFAQLQVPVGERVTVRGGARYELFDLTVDDFTRPAVFYAFPLGGGNYYPFVLAPLGVTGGNFSYDAVTFNLGATVKLTERVELYGGFSQGFSLPDVGAFTRRAGANDFTYSCGLPPIPGFPCYTGGATISYAGIGPEAQIVNNYEVGIRGSIGKVTAALAGFISTSDKGVTFDIATNTISQQKERIWGVEFTGEFAATSSLTLGTVLAYREGRYDSNKDGDIDSYLPNNRITTPFRAYLYGSYRFDSGTVLRVEGEAFNGRDRVINLAGDHYEIEPGAIMNLALSHPIAKGTAYVAVQNVFDRDYQNPSATATRNLPVHAWGRTVTVGYRTTW